ncbi:MAG: hypothetical protein NT092_10815 [Bacteroidia bacterium]|nr:hypothetical protein [Bacteroidia bacterium]
MNTKPDSTAFLMMLFFLMLPLIATAQTDRKATELKNLEKGITVARARVQLNQKQIADADSLIKLGFQIIREGKAETGIIYSESNKIEKNYSSKHKPLVKLSTSKDKAEAAKARADLKALDAQYRADNITLETRLRSAERKQSAGASQIIRGKTAKLNARDALKTSTAALKAAQDKFDAAAPAETRKTK